MAANLVAAGLDVIVRDAVPAAQASFAAEHACRVAELPADFADVSVLVTMLPDDRAVRELMLDWQGGVAAALSAGSVLLDMSSSNPNGTLGLAEELAAREISIVDAPVSGGIPRATDGTLTLMVGADDEDALALAEPILDVLGDRRFRTGPLGSGHAMKALNNYAHAAAYASATEALAIGERYGLTPSTMVDVLNASTGRSFASEVVLRDHVVSGRYATGFALGLLAKDVGIADDLARARGVDAPLCRLVDERFAQALEGLGFAADHSQAHTRWWTTDLADATTPRDG
jgi:3-hydroxyisobutyrate dehydrogenase